MADDLRSAEARAHAVALRETGAWQEPHRIVQDQRSTLAAWLHGIVHTLEGDLDNARYWYWRARHAFPGPEGVGAEITEARDRVGVDPEPQGGRG
jgi:hypothetical protein